jgi:hypothetical protein
MFVGFHNSSLEHSSFSTIEPIVALFFEEDGLRIFVIGKPWLVIVIGTQEPYPGIRRLRISGAWLFFSLLGDMHR